ncbi:hypothetical protein FNH07_03530 [Amycolatopsis bartoniae]|nr:hypothetical protein FNH07_03530 [Amycolatopsis bartoniae]
MRKVTGQRVVSLSSGRLAFRRTDAARVPPSLAVSGVHPPSSQLESGEDCAVHRAFRLSRPSRRLHGVASVPPAGRHERGRRPPARGLRPGGPPPRRPRPPGRG